MEFGALFGTLSGTTVGVPVSEADFIDEMLVEGCWVETTAAGSYGRNFMQQQQPCGSGSGSGSGSGVVAADPSQSQQHCLALATSDQQQQMLIQQLQDDESNCVVGKRWWIGPMGNPGPSSSVKDRLVVAVGYLKDYTNPPNTNVLIQIWVPPRTRRSLVCDELLTPNPNPNLNVRFFRSHECPRLHHYDARGCLALPVFERGSGTCLGVLEINVIKTNQNIINYGPQLQLENLSNALQAADFSCRQNFIPPAPAVKVFDELYQAAVNEIVEVLTCVCKTHNLPLALTWAPCIQQGKCGCSHSAENYVWCVSTVDSACFVADLDILGFQEACSEYHLFRGQGIVGTAFTTTRPCFAIDITAFSKSEYPLAHHAKMFGLHAAVAIPLRSVYTGSAADFVLEFFLPKDCHDTQQQRHILSSLSILVQQACRSLHVVTDDDHFTFPPPPPPHNIKQQEEQDEVKLLFASPSSQSQSHLEPCSKESSWIAHMMEAQQKGKGVSVSLEMEYLQEPKEEFKVTTNWEDGSNDVFSDFGQVEQNSGSRSRASTVEAPTHGHVGEESYSFGGRRSSTSGGRKSGEKRRTKAEKTISLPVLRQYFAGSLKDAAKSIGVCPTTLKRICRQHGITRWPSRKIKKVGHSLKKLQLVIDSVQGAEGSIQIGSFYTSFPELCSAASGRSDSSKNMHTYPGSENNNNGLYGHGDACGQTTFGPNFSCATTTGNLLPSTIINTNTNNGDVLMTESPESDALVKRAQSEAAELHASIQEDTKVHFTRSKGQQTLPPPLSQNPNSRERVAFRVKATFVDEKIRFSLQPNWGFRELQLEIARRFNLNDVSNMDLKYLDDDGEWVLLACDADLEECKDLHWSSQSRTIRLSLFQASPINIANTFGGSTSPS